MERFSKIFENASFILPHRPPGANVCSCEANRELASHSYSSFSLANSDSDQNLFYLLMLNYVLDILSEWIRLKWDE